MKLVFSKSDLNKAVGIVMKAVPTRTTMNILECILIDATTNVIKFTGNDMELGIETIVEGEIIEKGKVAIDAKLFSEIVRKLPDSEITITTDANYTSLITCEKSKFNIAGKSGDDFSYLPIIEKDKMITISQFNLREVINQTIFSTAPNDNNKMMTGELFEVSDNVLKVVRDLDALDLAAGEGHIHLTLQIVVGAQAHTGQVLAALVLGELFLARRQKQQVDKHTHR